MEADAQAIRGGGAGGGSPGLRGHGLAKEEATATPTKGKQWWGKMRRNDAVGDSAAPDAVSSALFKMRGVADDPLASPAAGSGMVVEDEIDVDEV